MVEEPAPSATNGWPQKGNPLIATPISTRNCNLYCSTALGWLRPERASWLRRTDGRFVLRHRASRRVYIYIYTAVRAAHDHSDFTWKFVSCRHGPLFLSRQYNDTKKALYHKYAREPPSYDGCSKKGHLEKGLGPSSSGLSPSRSIKIPSTRRRSWKCTCFQLSSANFKSLTLLVAPCAPTPIAGGRHPVQAPQAPVPSS